MSAPHAGWLGPLLAGLAASGCAVGPRGALWEIPSRVSIPFAGRSWAVRHGDLRGGPGDNRWADDPGAVHIDGAGRLHLRMTRQPAGGWASVEVFTPLEPGAVRISVRLDSRTDDLPTDVIAGLFVYRNDDSELDIELGRWSARDPRNGQFVVQPHTRPGHRTRFTYREARPGSVHTITWCPGVVHFETRLSDAVRRWRFQGRAVPAPVGHRLHLNLWSRSAGRALVTRSPPTLVVAAVEITPLSPADPACQVE